MSKHRTPAPFPVAPHATTAGPGFVATVTKDPNLEVRTLAVVPDKDGQRLRVFRQSSTEYDHLGCEVYARQGDSWVFRHKEPVKYVPPEEFQGKRVEIDGVPFWSLEEISPSQVAVLRALLRRGPA